MTRKKKIEVHQIHCKHCGSEFVEGSETGTEEIYIPLDEESQRGLLETMDQREGCSKWYIRCTDCQYRETLWHHEFLKRLEEGN
jgi:ribosomal protein S27E